MDGIPQFYNWISCSSAAAWEIFLHRELEDYLSVHDEPWVMGEVFSACKTLQASLQTTHPDEHNEVLAASVNPFCEVCHCICVYRAWHRTASNNIIHSTINFTHIPFTCPLKAQDIFVKLESMNITVVRSK